MEPNEAPEQEWDPSQTAAIADFALANEAAAAFDTSLGFQTMIIRGLQRQGMSFGAAKLRGKTSLPPAEIHRLLSAGQPVPDLDFFATLTARPGQFLYNVYLPAGSLILLPATPEIPEGQFSLIASPTVILGTQLPAVGLTAGDAPLDGWFVRTVEPGPPARLLKDHFARRLLSLDGTLAPGIFLLTLVFPSSVYSVQPSDSTFITEGPMDPVPGPSPTQPPPSVGDLTKNFSLKQLNPHNFPLPASVEANLRKLAPALQTIRDTLAQPVQINSGYRSPEYNATVSGSAKNSQHTFGRAADLKVPGMKPSVLKAVIEKLITQRKIPQGGVGLYSSFVHYDIRGAKARWNG